MADPRPTRALQWRLPLGLAAVGLLVYLSAIISNVDLSELACLLIVFPTVIFTLLFLGLRQRLRNGFAALPILTLYIAFSWVCFRHSDDVRASGRWLLRSKAYKAEVMAQPEPPSGSVRHMEWDGWGWAGSDTVVYLVFDPKDSLSAELKDRSSGSFSGIPCEVPHVKRLEKQWYSVVFYTNEAWAQCS